MDSKPTLNELAEKLTSNQRSYVKDLLKDVSRNALRLQSYPDALAEVLRSADYTRATSDYPIKECSQENPPIDEVNYPMTLLFELQSELNKLLERSAAESYERQHAIWQELMVDLGLDKT